MTFRHTVIGAVLLLGLAQAASAQSVVSSAPAVEPGRGRVLTSAPPPVDVARLPIDMRRIQREFRQASVREERNGLNLRYFVEVYGEAPPLVFLTKEDNLRYGPVPYGAPTHSDILRVLTPPAHRGSLYALPLFRLPMRDSRKGK